MKLNFEVKFKQKIAVKLKLKLKLKLISNSKSNWIFAIKLEIWAEAGNWNWNYEMKSAMPKPHKTSSRNREIEMVISVLIRLIPVTIETGFVIAPPSFRRFNTLYHGVCNGICTKGSYSHTYFCHGFRLNYLEVPLAIVPFSSKIPPIFNLDFERKKRELASSKLFFVWKISSWIYLSNRKSFPSLHAPLLIVPRWRFLKVISTLRPRGYFFPCLFSAAKGFDLFFVFFFTRWETANVLFSHPTRYCARNNDFMISTIFQPPFDICIGVLYTVKQFELSEG